MRNWDRDSPLADAHDYANRDVKKVGICERCKEPIYGWEDYYDIEGVLLHYDCEFGYMARYLKIQGER